MLYLGTAWGLVSWWPHDNVHVANGENLQGLLYIEYGFHTTLMAAAMAIAWSLLTLQRPSPTGETQARSSSAGGLGAAEGSAR